MVKKLKIVLKKFLNIYFIAINLDAASSVHIS